mgnify:CR=1 FL=1
MTRKEAIKWQEAFKKTYGNLPPEATEACDMAIEALQEPDIVHCKDCKYWLRTRIGEEELNQCGLAGYLIGGRGYCLYGKKAGEQE